MQFSYVVNLGSVCLSILFTCIICFCLIYFNLGNVSSCIDMYLGIFEKPGSRNSRQLPQVHVLQAASGDMFTNTFFCR